MDCSTVLVQKAGAPKTILVPYFNGGPNLSRDVFDFYDYTKIGGCEFSCNYGETCGEATSFSGTYAS